MSAPCGISKFRNKYHVFYLYNPDAPRWGYMHWGHSVTEDLIEYEELPPVLIPEAGKSLCGGSSIVAKGKMYLFYAVDNIIRSVVSEDGRTFTDTGYEALTGDYDTFTDPHVFGYEGRYLMLVGTGRHNVAGIALYSSADLSRWEFVSDLISDLRFGSHIESPNLFAVDDKWCLMFTSSRQLPSRNICALGEFDGSSFVTDGDFFSVESGPDLYNPYVVRDEDRNLMLGWYFDRRSTSGISKGMLTCAREVSLNKAGELLIRPAAELYDHRLVVNESGFVVYDNGRLKVSFEKRTMFDKAYREQPVIETVEDVGTVEAFMNGGTDNVTIVVC